MKTIKPARKGVVMTETKQKIARRHSTRFRKMCCVGSLVNTTALALLLVSAGGALCLHAQESLKPLKEVVSESGDSLSLVSLAPGPSLDLKGGDRVTATIRYKAATVKRVRIWATGSVGSYQPSRPLSPEGEVTRWFYSDKPAQSDMVNIQMVEVLDNEGRGKTLAVLKFPASYKWSGYMPGCEPVAVIGQPFPELKFKSVDGRDIDVAQLKGKVVLVDFWATWCGPCKAAMPAVQKAYDQYKGLGLEVLGISLDQDQAKLTSYLQSEKIPWPQYFDGGGWDNAIVKRFHVDSIPRFFILDRNGVLRYDSADNNEDFVGVIRKLLGTDAIKTSETTNVGLQPAK